MIGYRCRCPEWSNKTGCCLNSKKTKTSNGVIRKQIKPTETPNGRLTTQHNIKTIKNKDLPKPNSHPGNIGCGDCGIN